MRARFLIIVAVLMGLVTLCAFAPRLSASAAPVIYANQGWSESDRNWWQTVSQGSRMLPFAWIQALEQAESTEAFLAPAHMAQLGYPPNSNGKGLPIGFAIDQSTPDGFFRKVCRFFGLSCGKTVDNTRWLGLNCSACHTAQITYKGKTIEVEGAPTLADFQLFQEQMLAAMKATRKAPDKWRRFVAATGEDEGTLAPAFDKQIAWYDRLEKKNGVAMRYGPGRLDAQGHILNKVSLIVGVEDQIPGLPSDAPASYPFIWNVPQQDLIQWNGIVKNQKPVTIRGQKTDFGALGRNVGEVIGVFGEIDTSKEALGYASSINVTNLIDIERQLGRLNSPGWPTAFPKINDALKQQGEQVYTKYGCHKCHDVIGPGDLATRITIKMDPIEKQGTDILLACNTFQHQSKSGYMEGRKSVTEKQPITAVSDTRNMLENAVVGGILGRADEIASTIVNDTLFGGDRKRVSPRAAPPPNQVILPGVKDPAMLSRAEKCLRASNDLLKYKARPLNGIWATAPYLHNGSVPTLYDLLLPSKLRIATTNGASAPSGPGPFRPDTFYIQREFDPEKVGYVSDKAERAFVFKTHADTGEPIVGNYNSGHDYGTEMPEPERRALVEYLKSL